MKPDVEMWQAIHDGCPYDGCGHCVKIDLDWDEDKFALVESAAAIKGMSLDTFIHLALLEHLDRNNA